MTSKTLGAWTLAGALTVGGIYEGTAPNKPVDHAAPGEIVAERTEYAKVYPGAGPGQRMAVVADKPVHYRDEDGKWKEPDLVRKAKPALVRLVSRRTHEVTAGPYRAEFDPSKPWDYRYERNGASIEYEAQFDTTAAVAIPIGTSIRGVKERVILQRGAPVSLSWIIRVDGGTIHGDAGGGWYVTNGDGLRAFEIPALTAVDAGGKRVPVEATLAGDLLTATVDTSGAEWPVTVDPSTVVAATDFDALSGYIDPQSQTTYALAHDAETGIAVSYDTDLHVGQAKNSTAAWTVFRILMRYDTHMLPVGSIVDTVKAKFVVSYNNSTVITHLKCYAPNDSLDAGHFNDSMFNEFKGWTSGASRYTDGAVPLSDSLAIVGKAVGDTMTFRMNTLGKSAVKIGGTTQFFVLTNKDVNRSIPEVTYYETISFGDDSSYLQIWYTPPPVVPAANFRLTPISPTALRVTWTGVTTDNDSLILCNFYTGARLKALNKAANADTVTGLNPYVKYALKAKAFKNAASDTVSSNADSVYTGQNYITVDIDASHAGNAENLATAVYDSARAETKAESLYAETNYLGQVKSGSVRNVFRHFFDFPLPAMVRVEAESLLVKGAADHSVTEFDIEARAGTWRGGTADKMRFTAFDGWMPQMAAYGGVALITPFSTAGFSLGIPNRMPFTSAGRDTTFRRGTGADTLRVMLLSSRDVSGIAPTGDEYVIINPAADSTVVRLTYAPPDAAPSGVHMTGIAPDSVLVQWTDRAYSERGYIVEDLDTGTKVAGSDTTAANATGLRIGGLSANTKYRWRIRQMGGSGHGLVSAPDSCYSGAAKPGAPTRSNPAPDSTRVILNAGGNPAYTRYAVGAVTTAAGETLWVDWTTGMPVFRSWGTVGKDSLWAYRTRPQMGGDGGFVMRTGVGKIYRWIVRAKNGA